MEEIGWIAAAQAGDLDAFNQLVLAYQDRVYRQAWWIVKDRETAEDITQDIFLQAFLHISTFRGGSFRAWLMRIATNAGLDELRRRKRRVMLSLTPVDEHGEEREALDDLADQASSIEDHVERSELAGVLQCSLEELPLKYRLLVQMVDIEEMDYAEAARALGIPLGTVKSRLLRARLRLKEGLRAAPEYFPSPTSSAASIPLAC